MVRANGSHLLLFHLVNGLKSVVTILGEATPLNIKQLKLLISLISEPLGSTYFVTTDFPEGMTLAQSVVLKQPANRRVPLARYIFITLTILS
jgi:uncharacterized membrane protein YccF (DUF307 family)